MKPHLAGGPARRLSSFVHPLTPFTLTTPRDFCPAVAAGYFVGFSSRSGFLA